MPRPIKPPARPRTALLRLKAKRERLLLEEESRQAGRARRHAREAAADRAARVRWQLIRSAEARHARAPTPPTPAAEAVRERVAASADARQEARWAELLGGAPAAP